MSTSVVESALNTLIDSFRQLILDGRHNEEDIVEKLVKDTAKKLSKKLSKKEIETKKVKGKKTVYQIFCAKNRDASLSFIEANRAISAKWKEMSDDEKAAFAASVQSEIDADVARFNEEKASSEESSSDENDTNGEKSEKKKKDPNAPKRPLGSFMLFCKDQREAHSEWKGVEGTKRISEAWNALSASEKKVYTDKAKDLMDAFKGVAKADKPVEEVVVVEEKKEKTAKKVEKKEEKTAKKVEKKEEKAKDESSDEKVEKIEKKAEKAKDDSSDEKNEKVEKKAKKAKKVADE
jgi:hypothetical protein